MTRNQLCAGFGVSARGSDVDIEVNMGLFINTGTDRNKCMVCIENIFRKHVRSSTGLDFISPDVNC